MEYTEHTADIVKTGSTTDIIVETTRLCRLTGNAHMSAMERIVTEKKTQNWKFDVRKFQNLRTASPNVARKKSDIGRKVGFFSQL
jgi:hypothetical protein